jgi:hypothetical protein
MTEILREVAGFADRASELKQALLRLIAEIERDHIPCDDDTAWAIAFGVRPSFLAFHLKGLLEVLVDDVLDELEADLRGTVVMTDAQLQRDWQEREREWAGVQASQELISAEDLPS